ncbi:MAG TPA: hypothetical protein P5077_04550 [bacterium]|nr:hypothetical protein [bacterium]
MRKLIALFMVMFMALPLFAERQIKLAVMEIEDKSGTISVGILEKAADFLRAEFVSSGKFVVIDKTRQAEKIKEMVKEQKKESWKECYDKNCRIELGQSLAADHILYASITQFGGSYILAVEMLDLAKEAIVGGAKADFADDEASLKKAIQSIVFKMTGSATKYSTSGFSYDQGGVKLELGGVELAAVSTVDMSVVELSEVETQTVVSAVSAFQGTVDLNQNAELLPVYDAALKADKTGNDKPKEAIAAWQKVADFPGVNPYKEKAVERIDEWNTYIWSLELAEMYKKTVAIDRMGMVAPEKALAAWQNLAAQQGYNPYRDKAVFRADAWRNYITAKQQYNETMEKFRARHDKDRKQLAMVLPLTDAVNKEQKQLFVEKYMELYLPYYGEDDLLSLIKFIKDEAIEKEIRDYLYSQKRIETLKERCDKEGDPAACYQCGFFFEKNILNNANFDIDTTDMSLKKFEATDGMADYYKFACDGSIIPACLKVGRHYYKTIGDGQKGYPFLRKACEYGIAEGCKYIVEMNKGRGETVDSSVDMAVYEKLSEQNLVRPYKWYAVGLFGGAAVTFGLGGYFLWAMSDHADKQDVAYDNYTAATTAADIQKWKAKMTDEKNAANLNMGVGIGMMAAGALLAGAGTWLILIREEEKPFAWNLVPTFGGAYLSFNTEF